MLLFNLNKGPVATLTCLKPSCYEWHLLGCWKWGISQRLLNTLDDKTWQDVPGEGELGLVSGS